MNKVYTIIDIWDDDGGSCWVKNYSRKEDCLKMLSELLHRRDMVDERTGLVNSTGRMDDDGNPFSPNEVLPYDGIPIGELYDSMLMNGYGYHYCDNAGMHGVLFVRDQAVNDEFNPDQYPS